MKIEDAIKQSKFENEYHKVHVNILFTAAYLNQLVATTLKPYNLTGPQFNVLRILRGLHPEPATIKLITARMIDKMSNASRLVEKLKQKGYVERIACEEDRRRVNVTITAKGLDLLEQASAALSEFYHEEQAFGERRSGIVE